jgi:hypothetical protein
MKQIKASCRVFGRRSLGIVGVLTLGLLLGGACHADAAWQIRVDGYSGKVVAETTVPRAPEVPIPGSTETLRGSSYSDPITLPMAAQRSVMVIVSILSPGSYGSYGTGTATLTYHPKPSGPSILNDAVSWIAFGAFAYDEPGASLVRAGLTSIEGIGGFTRLALIGRTAGVVEFGIGPRLDQIQIRNTTNRPMDIRITLIY